ncbi:SWIM-type [Hexamita inflata]|uniref:SWIM-type n=1 Tax=Hexamita inflata TaxID=28002 RepID=A0AA86RBT1_9EUKA|nr:SWIM-type [Hexamita inflata]
MKIENHIKRTAINKPNDIFGSFVPIVHTFVDQQMKIAESYTHTIFRGKFRIFLNKTFLVEFENDEPIESQECSCMVMKVQQCPCSHILYFIQRKGQISNFDLVRTFVNHDLFSISKYVDQMDLLYGNQRRIHGEVIKQRIKRDREGVMDEINFEEEPASYEEMKRLLLKAFDEVDVEKQQRIVNYAAMEFKNQKLHLTFESKNIAEKFSRYKASAELYYK